MKPVQQTSDWFLCQNPLIISSSGGNGHLIAAQSLIEQLQVTPLSLPQHLLTTPSQFSLPLEKILFKLSELSHHPKYAKLINKICPIKLPKPRLIRQEIESLKAHQAKNRVYLDYMLDLQPEGFILTALFNLIQRTSHGPSLHHLTYHQPILDRCSQPKMQKKLTDILMHGIHNQKPYDIILMTQPMGLQGICEVVYNYNQQIPLLQEKYQLKLKKLEIHQFITDIPSPKAIHYLRPLQKLESRYQSQLHVHCMECPTNAPLNTSQTYFYSPEKLPIIRQAFKQSIPHNGNNIDATATIMLSSSNGDLTINYLNVLSKFKFKKIMVVGELTPAQQEKIKQIQTKIPGEVILCGYVQAPKLAKILQGSDCIILKGGGMSLMELAALKSTKKRLICLHQNHIEAGLSLSWEDGNNAWFVHHYEAKKEKVVLTNPHQLQPILESWTDERLDSSNQKNKAAGK
jgi:effector protein SdbA